MSALEMAVDLARQFEGFSHTPYHDPVGYPTIGHGHLLSRKPWDDLSQWPEIDEEEGERLLALDMGKAVDSCHRLITVPLEDNQWAALYDFALNCGAGNLQVSTLRRVIQRGDLEDAPAQFKRWVYARKVKLRGLVRRRQAEADLWNGIW